MRTGPLEELLGIALVPLPFEWPYCGNNKGGETRKNECVDHDKSSIVNYGPSILMLFKQQEPHHAESKSDGKYGQIPLNQGGHFDIWYTMPTYCNEVPSTPHKTPQPKQKMDHTKWLVLAKVFVTKQQQKSTQKKNCNIQQLRGYHVRAYWRSIPLELSGAELRRAKVCRLLTWPGYTP